MSLYIYGRVVWCEMGKLGHFGSLSLKSTKKVQSCSPLTPSAATETPCLANNGASSTAINGTLSLVSFHSKQIFMFIISWLELRFALLGFSFFPFWVKTYSFCQKEHILHTDDTTTKKLYNGGQNRQCSLEKRCWYFQWRSRKSPLKKPSQMDTGTVSVTVYSHHYIAAHNTHR